MNTEAVKTCPKCQAVIPAEAPQGLCPKCLLAAASIATDTGHTAEASGLPSLETIAAGFPQLEILEFIGQGGMGLVFKARQAKLDRFVALKLLPQKPGADPSFCERFNREARVLARLSHPNIVAVHDFGEAGPFFYLLMEFVDGVNLRQAMQAGRFTPEQALAIVPKICDALQYAHEEGVLHRDIKPENLLLDKRGRVKIADFGIAKLLGDPKDITLTAKGSAIGTPHYMAPEQLERPQDVDQRADVYSLGVVFYEMLTGELPIGRFAPPSEKASMDPRVDQVVLRSLEKERERRFQSAGDVKTQVEKITSNPAVSPGQPSGATNMAASPGTQPPPIQAGTSTTAGSLSVWFGWLITAGALAGLNLIALLTLLLLATESLAWHVLPNDKGKLVGVAEFLGTSALLALDGFVVWYLIKRWRSERALPHRELRALLGRLPRRAIWLSGGALAFLLLGLLVSHRHMTPLNEPAQFLPVQEPNAPLGYEVAPGGPPANHGPIYHSAITVPAGYALTITAVLCSNQVVLRPQQQTSTAAVLAPEGQPVPCELIWQLLGDTTIADGAPLRFSILLPGNETPPKSFHVFPPEPVSIDWVSEPPRVWPPQNGHTRFLLVKGVNPSAEVQPAPEWAIGIEERLDPIPADLLSKLESPIVASGSNWSSQLEITSPASATNRLVATAVDSHSQAPLETVHEYVRICTLLNRLTQREQDLLLQFTPENTWVRQVREQIAANRTLRERLEKENPDLVRIQTEALHRVPGINQ